MLGLALAALAQLLGLFLASAGHGWVAPLYISVLLWVLLPVTLSVAWPLEPVTRGSQANLLVLAVIGLGADAVLIDRTIDEAGHLAHYVEINGAVGLLLIGIWLCLWLSWQAMICWALVDSRRRPDDAYD